MSSDPVLVRLSPSLVHTVAVATKVWSSSGDGPEEEEETPNQRQVVMSAHFSVCNDTVEDVVLGQVRGECYVKKVVV